MVRKPTDDEIADLEYRDLKIKAMTCDLLRAGLDEIISAHEESRAPRGGLDNCLDFVELLALIEGLDERIRELEAKLDRGEGRDRPRSFYESLGSLGLFVRAGFVAAEIHVYEGDRRAWRFAPPSPASWIDTDTCDFVLAIRQACAAAGVTIDKEPAP